MTVFILIFLLIAVMVTIGGIYGWKQEQKRRQALAAAATRLGLSFSSEKNYELAGQLGFLDRLQKGSNRYCYHVARGAYEGHEVIVCDYHYETYSRGKHGRQTHHHYLNLTTMIIPVFVPELQIAPESFLDKIASSLGFDDIDFESAEFSRKFKVTSPDKKFAYDFCHARMIEYLLLKPDQILEVEGNTLAEIRRGRLTPKTLRSDLEHLAQIRSLIPGYLLKTPPPQLP
ncbi:MAG: hypothetical protein AAGK14_02860 [Verrucomicrobiota bacterium]